MNEEHSLSFEGPFGWLREPGLPPCIFDSPLADQKGIYLWTIATNQGDLVHYVGETGASFRERLTQHLHDQLSGKYRIYDPAGFGEGRKDVVPWRGLFGKGDEREASVVEFAAGLDAFAPLLSELIRMIRFHVAPFDGEKHLRQRIESSLADFFYAQPDPIGSFQDAIWYNRKPHPSEPFSVTCEWGSLVRGAPEAFAVPAQDAGVSR